MSDTGFKERWYFKTAFLVVAFLCIGPFILPLVWFKPDLGIRSKIIMTLIILALSVSLAILLSKSLESINEYYKMLQI
ncbi:MAG TPA: hypothetical protein PLV52_03580 [Candidatus Omnitrophota bacterium]|nr:hypothetical protein [Candidatus Omnitrophota bacterium]